MTIEHLLPRLLSAEELWAAFVALEEFPKENGRLEMIVCRPRKGERLVLEQAELHRLDGLKGDNWKARGSSLTEDGSAPMAMQITVMNSRVIQLIAQDCSLWPLAGDQLFIDLDLSSENLQPGQQITIGDAILEITDAPHNGCKKFTERYGSGATQFVNSKEGRRLRLRGANTRIIRGGLISVESRVLKA